MNGQYFPNCDSQIHNYDMKKIESKIHHHISIKYILSINIYIYVYIAVGGLDVQIFSTFNAVALICIILWVIPQWLVDVVWVIPYCPRHPHYNRMWISV